MSALGHKRTFAVQKGMSALPPKADINRHICACISPTDFMTVHALAKSTSSVAHGLAPFQGHAAAGAAGGAAANTRGRLPYMVASRLVGNSKGHP
jgi:hypothetical protein